MYNLMTDLRLVTDVAAPQCSFPLDNTKICEYKFGSLATLAYHEYTQSRN